VRTGTGYGYNSTAMAVTVERQNLGDAQRSKEIALNIEHALSNRPGDWRVSIAGSRASENWEMRIEDRTASRGPTVYRAQPDNMNLRPFAV